jgi:cytochrome c556
MGRKGGVGLAVRTLSVMLVASVALLTAQTSSTNAPQEVHANLNQLMRGVLYPAANVVFSAQSENPADAKQALDPGMATDPLASTFGGWQAVENAALALAESGNLLLVPGRVCSNGVPVPLSDPAWATFVQEVRDAGMKAYKAAQAKDQDKVSELSETLSASCAHCHRKWRDRKAPANRCK